MIKCEQCNDPRLVIQEIWGPEPYPTQRVICTQCGTVQTSWETEQLLREV